MKNIFKRQWIAVVFLLILSVSARAQMESPAETRKQAKAEIKAEQKKEKQRRKEAKMAKNNIEKENADFLDEKVTKKRKGKTPKSGKESKRDRIL